MESKPLAYDKNAKLKCFCGNNIFEESKSGALYFIACPCCGMRSPGYLTQQSTWAAWGWIQAKLGGTLNGEGEGEDAS